MSIDEPHPHRGPVDKASLAVARHRARLLLEDMDDAIACDRSLGELTNPNDVADPNEWGNAGV